MAIKKRFPYKAAFVACNGGCRATADCQYGCVGCELCVNACKFEAIALNDYGVAEVNEDKCIACGKCVRECPRELIRIHECANPVVVKCSNQDPGKDARKMCEVSCIGCGICEKYCPAGAIKGKHMRTVPTKCISCMRCVSMCSTESRKVPAPMRLAAHLTLKKLCSERKEPKFYL